MWISDYIYETAISEDLLNILENTFSFCKEKNYEDKKKNCTISGFQTHNIVYLIPKIFFENFDIALEGFLSKRSERFLFDKTIIPYMNFIEYEAGGHQLMHNHYFTDDFSFIIFMNDSNGLTKFSLPDKDILVKPERGKLVVFDSFVWHGALTSSNNKKVAVGRILMYNKKIKQAPDDETGEYYV